MTTRNDRPPAFFTSDETQTSSPMPISNNSLAFRTATRSVGLGE